MDSFSFEHLMADLTTIDFTAPLSAEEAAAVGHIEYGIRAELGEPRPQFVSVPPPPAPIAAAAGFNAADVFAIDLAAPLEPEEEAAVAQIEADLLREVGELRPRARDLHPAVAQIAPNPAYAPYPAAFAPPPAPHYAPAWYPAPCYPQPPPAEPAPEPQSPQGSVSPPLANGRQPKRPRNSYMLWAQSRRAQIRAENPEAGNGGASKILGRRWKEEAPEVVAYYEALAEEERRIHKEKYPHYIYHGNNRKKSKKTAAAEPLVEQPRAKRRRVQDPAPPAPAHLPPPPPAPAPKVLMLPRGGRMVFAPDDVLQQRPMFVNENGEPVALIPLN